MGCETDHRGTDGHECIDGARYRRRIVIEQISHAQEYEHDGSQVDHQQTQVNPHDSLSKNCHEKSIGGIDAGQLYAVGQLVRRNPLEHKVPHVGKLALIPLQGNGEQSHSDYNDEQKDEAQAKARPQREPLRGLLHFPDHIDLTITLYAVSSEAPFRVRDSGTSTISEKVAADWARHVDAKPVNPSWLLPLRQGRCPRRDTVL